MFGKCFHNRRDMPAVIYWQSGKQMTMVPSVSFAREK